MLRHVSIYHSLKRNSKLVSTVVSTFTANYVALWSQHFPSVPLTSPFPTFDGRAVCYPTVSNLRDYLSWRQADCHINNLYNTAFWQLIQLGGLGNKEAEETLKGTLAADKNEILFSRFGINYNRELEIYKKGSVIFRDVRSLTIVRGRDTELTICYSMNSLIRRVTTHRKPWTSRRRLRSSRRHRTSMTRKRGQRQRLSWIT